MTCVLGLKMKTLVGFELTADLERSQARHCFGAIQAQARVSHFHPIFD